MAVEPELVLRGGQHGECGGGGVAAKLGGQAGHKHEQPLQQPTTLQGQLKAFHMPRTLRLQAVCGAASCVDESPTAAAAPSLSLLRHRKDGGAELGGHEATSPHRKRGWLRPPGTFSRSLSRQPSRSGTDPNDVVRLDATSGESPTPSPGCVPCVRGWQGDTAGGSAVPLMTAAQAADTTAGGAGGTCLAMAALEPKQPPAAVERPKYGAPAAADVPASQQGAAAAAAAATPACGASPCGAPAQQQAAPALDPNDLAAMNARLAVGLASLPPPPPHSGDPSHSGGGGGSGGGCGGCSSQRDSGGSSGGGCQKRGRQQGARGGDGGGGGIASDAQTAACSESEDDDDSGPSPAARPVKVQRIAIGMSTTDLPAAAAAAARHEDEGTWIHPEPLGPGDQDSSLEPVLQLPPGCDRQRLPEIQVFQGFWGLDDARRRRDRLFVFGDNDARRGLAGQAAIRGEPNAIGLATKRSPSHVAHAYYRDEDFEANAAKISAGVVGVLHALLEGYVPDADAHPGVHADRDGPAEPAAGRTAASGCAATPAAAAAGLQDPPVLAGGEQRHSEQHQQPQARRLAYRALVVPSDGFGTGRARLHTDAPRTFAFLKHQVCQLLELLQPGAGDALDW